MWIQEDKILLVILYHISLISLTLSFILRPALVLYEASLFSHDSYLHHQLNFLDQKQQNLKIDRYKTS